ncbi:hypothetical protein [Sorangium cellulosum]|uniref:hypothetical protein n=1 Tax=Sorangium cellulosum TaxID=56 RepID=UPI0003F58FCA|nr:hypothetical protein [Sorangium cellulosum]
MQHDLLASLAARAVPLVFSLSALSASCSRGAPEPPSLDGTGGHTAAGDASQGSTHASGTAGEAATGASVPGDAGPGAPPDASEHPGDSTWRATGWLDRCQIDVADEPSKALPHLRWEQCPGNAPGCTSLVVDWDAGKYPKTASPSVVRWGDGYRVGLYFEHRGERRTGVYDADGRPLAAWRFRDLEPTVPAADPQPEYCIPTVPSVGHERVWLGAMRVSVGAPAAAYLVSGYDALATASQPIPVDALSQGLHTSDDTFALSGPGPGTINIYDRISNQAKTFGRQSGNDAPSFRQMYPVGDHALGLAVFEVGTSEGWIWNRRTHTIEPLLRAEPPRVVADIKSDGQTLVWLEAEPYSDDGLYGASSLWTSPFAATKADLAPKKRREGPIIGYPLSAAGEGFYAVYAIGEKVIHVYRLSDAHHWSFKTPPELFDIQDIAHVDSREVWVWVPGGIVRQAISELGPGDPAP